MGLWPVNENSDYITYNLWQKEIAWGIVALITLISAIIMILRSKDVKEQSEVQSKVFLSIGIFMIGYAFTRIFFILSDFARWNEGVSMLYTRFVFASYTVGFISAIPMVNTAEKHLLDWKKQWGTKIFYILSIIAIVLLFSAGVAVDKLDAFRLVFTIFGSISSVILLLLFFNVLKLSTGELKKKSLYMVIGILIVFLGNIVDSDMVMRNLSIPVWVPAILPMLGFIIIDLFQKPSSI